MRFRTITMKLPLCFALLVFATNLFAVDRDAVMKQELPKLQKEYRATELTPLGPETPLSRICYARLIRFVSYAQKGMQNWSREPGAKFHKQDGSLEGSVRQNGDIAFAFAVLASYGDFDESKAGVSRARVKADASALIRYLAITHVANFLPTGDGKLWGDHWQSAFWSGFIGAAAWLLWNDLPDDTKVMVARMVIHEANRFNTRPPDNGEKHDTKAEENGWNSEIIALAACMFQQHPNASIWRDRVILYMANSFSIAADHANRSPLDGRPTRDWVITTNIHSDFTLENHNRVHPDYLSCFTLNLHNAGYYKLAGMTPPAAAFHHARDCSDVLKHLTATNGSLFYINGQDWWPHRHEVPMIAEALASIHFSDPDAASIERGALAWLGKMHQRFDDGRALDPREVTYPNAAEELMIGYAKLYLAHRLFGDGPPPSSPLEFQQHQSTTRIFEKGGFVTHRTPAKFVSFCWANNIMGLLYPSDDTWFTAPQEGGLVGSIDAVGVKDTPPKLETRSINKLQLSSQSTNDGFAFVGKLSRCEGRIEQRIAVISLPDAPVLYIEQLRARQTVNLKEVATATVSILNEDASPICPNQRQIWTSNGELRVPGATDGSAERHILQSDWVNIDDKLGVAAHAANQMLFVANHKYHRGRLAQTLAANYRQNLGHREPGQVISEAVVGFVPNSIHTARANLRVQTVGNGAFLIACNQWNVRVNLGDSEIKTIHEGTNLAAFSADVSPAPTR
jgi:hypothetical protein